MTKLTFNHLDLSHIRKSADVVAVYSVSAEDCDNIGYVVEADVPVHSLVGGTFEDFRWAYTVDLNNIGIGLGYAFRSRKQAAHALLEELRTAQALGLQL